MRLELTDILVDDEIDWEPDRDGVYSTPGGRNRIWHSWMPQGEHLDVLRYTYH